MARCERHAALDRSIDLTSEVSASCGSSGVDPRRNPERAPDFSARNCVTLGYSLGTQVAIEAGFDSGMYDAGAFHQFKLRLQV